MDGSAVCLRECLWIGCGSAVTVCLREYLWIGCGWVCFMPEGVFMDGVWMGVLYA